MPTRVFGCECGCEFELFQGMLDEGRPVCPECGQEMKRLIGMTAGFIWRGPSGGFYGHGKLYAPKKASK